MLIALAENHKRVFADFAEKGGNYFCPHCSSPMILKKGRVKVAHFAHTSCSTSCAYTNESLLHQKIKASIYKSLLNRGLDLVEVEYPLEGCRPDVFFIKEGIQVAIEVQLTQLPADEIIRRTHVLNSQGVYVLWVTPDVPVAEDIRLKEMWRFLKGWNYGKLFTWDVRTQTMSALKWFGAFKFDEWTGWTRYYKTKGEFRAVRTGMSLVDDFCKTFRGFNPKFPQFPRAMLYLPKREKP